MKSQSNMRKIRKALDTLLLDMHMHQATAWRGEDIKILKVLFEGWFYLNGNHSKEIINKVRCKSDLEDFLYKTFEPFTTDSRLVGVKFSGYENNYRFYSVVARLPFKSEYIAYVLRRFDRFSDSKQSENLTNFVFD